MRKSQSQLELVLAKLARVSDGIVRIGPFDTPLRIMDQLAGNQGPALGQFVVLDGDWGINISRQNVSAASLASTFLHECLHAIIWTYGISTDDEEEQVVTLMAVALTALYRDNPWLADWLTSCLTGRDS